MQQPIQRGIATVMATVEEVLPLTGLAYLTDAEGMQWTVTKSTKGASIRDFAAGRQFRLVVERHGAFAVVRECRPDEDQVGQV